MGNEVFKSSVWVSVNLENILSDPKKCIVNGKPMITNMAKEICQNQYNGTFANESLCMKNGVSIPLAVPQCVPTNTSYNASTCESAKKSQCSSNGWKHIPPSSCILGNGNIQDITDTDKTNACNTLWGTYEEPKTISIKKTDPLIIRIIKFIIRMIVLVGVSVFIYIGVRYIMSAWDGELYDSEKTHLLVQIGAGILIALASMTILYFILSITGTGSDIIQSFSG